VTSGRPLRGTGRLASGVLAATVLLGSLAHAGLPLHEFLILHSYGWPAEQVTGRLDARSAQRIAGAHYNTVMCTEAELELVAKAGLRCLLIGRSQGAPDWKGESVSTAVASRLASNPAVWGYYLMDEPDNSNARRGALFPQLAEKVTAFGAADPNHVAWINVSSATGRFLDDYMSVVRPGLLSFDLYRWWARESDWWRGLEAHRDAALRAGVPMIVWIESNTSEKRFNAHLPPPRDNATKLRWSVYTSLAYGSKGVQWFLGSVDDDISALNAELSAMGPTLVNLRSTHVFHTSGVPREGLQLPDSSWYSSNARDLLIGEFASRGEPDATYLLIANKSIDGDADPMLEFRGRNVVAVEEVSRTSTGRTPLPTEQQAGVTRVRLHLGAGDGRLIRVQARQAADPAHEQP
jgi:hypothetical protein